MKRLVTVVLTSMVLTSVVLSGCSGDRPGAASATAPAPSVAGDASQADSLNAVLAGLDGVVGDLQRILVRDHTLTPDVTDRLRAIYTGPELLSQIDALTADVRAGLTGYKPIPGNRVSKVSRLITVSPICVFMEVRRDYSAVTTEVTGGPVSVYVVLVGKETAQDPKGYNPSPWTMIYDGVQTDGSQPTDICR